jgi:UDP-N-acetyl-2-amino-2-deoxyglucuronate dehydrogenase
MCMIDSSQNTTRRFRLGVAGCGKVFERLHLQAIQRCRKWQLVAACEPLKSRRDWIRNLLPRIAVLKNFEAFLKENQLDAVLIATPPKTHHILSIQALAAGHHVLVEKPMALSSVEALAMLKTAKQAQKLLLVGFNRRFRRPYRKMKDLLVKLPLDSIGEISYRLILNPAGWQSITAYLEEDGKGGGILEDVVSHQVDLLAWLFGTVIQKVRAKRLKEWDFRCKRFCSNLPCWTRQQV